MDLSSQIRERLTVLQQRAAQDLEAVKSALADNNSDAKIQTLVEGQRVYEHLIDVILKNLHNLPKPEEAQTIDQ